MKNELAINGGKPTRSTFIPYGKQCIDQEDIDSVIKVLKSDYLTCGPEIEEFEKTLADYLGVKYVVAVSSGTAALHAACFAAELKDGDEAITSPITFAATSNSILYMGAKPVFCDIDRLTYNISYNDIKNKINSKTKAILPVDFAGHASDLDEILEISKKHNLVVIEDAAHALGAEYKGRKVGSVSDMTIFSFHPVKHIATGEGGAIATNNQKYYEKIKEFRSHGITRDRMKILKDYGPWYYEMQSLGFNYRMTDIQAALGISQMTKLSRFLKRRNEIADIYEKELSKIEGVIVPYKKDYVYSPWHIYVIQIETEKYSVDRKTIFEALIAENIGVNVHYLPVYLHPYYKKMGYKEGLCPIAEKLYQRIITLPLFYSMTEEDTKSVIQALKKVLSYYIKK